MGQRPGRVQPLDNDFERHILILVGSQAARTHLSQQVGDGGITADVDPQHQRVDEEPDQLVQGLIQPAVLRQRAAFQPDVVLRFMPSVYHTLTPDGAWKSL